MGGDSASRKDQPSDFELTDELLQSARWPQPGSQRLARLEESWRHHWPVAGRRTIRLWLAAAAALILIAAGSIVWNAMRDGPSIQKTAENGHSHETAPPQSPLPQELQPAVSPKRERVPSPKVDVPRDAAPRRFASREPTPLEMLAFVRAGGMLPRSQPSRRPKDPDAVESPPKTIQPDWTERIGPALADLRLDPDADVAQIADSFRDDRALVEEELARRIRDSRGDPPIAEIRLLSEVCGLRSLPLLRRLFEMQSARESALAGLLRLESEQNLAQLVLKIEDRDLRQRTLATLLERDNPLAVELFLGFVNDTAFGHVALESLRLVTSVRVEQLFEFLYGPRQQLRLAAARVLGRLGDPAVLDQLMTMVLQNDHAHEAFIGLLSSPAEEVRGFLQQAQRDLSLVATLQSAEHHLDELVHEPGREEP